MNNNGIEFLQKICANYETKAENFKKVSAAIDLLIKIIQKDVRAANMIVSKGIISILTPLIMDIDSKDKNPNSDRNKLIRNACRVFKELTDLKKDDILVR